MELNTIQLKKSQFLLSPRVLFLSSNPFWFHTSFKYYNIQDNLMDLNPTSYIISLKPAFSSSNLS